MKEKELLELMEKIGKSFNYLKNNGGFITKNKEKISNLLDIIVKWLDEVESLKSKDNKSDLEQKIINLTSSNLELKKMIESILGKI